MRGVTSCLGSPHSFRVSKALRVTAKLKRYIHKKPKNYLRLQGVDLIYHLLFSVVGLFVFEHGSHPSTHDTHGQLPVLARL